MTDELKEQLSEVKLQLRLSMNGAVSESMREKGLHYRVNFGVELPRLKQIAKKFEKNRVLAQYLWNENVRESKILAAFLMPVDEFLPEVADIWVEDIRTQEIAELTTMNLFQYLPYAPSKAFQWIADGREYFQVCGFQLVARLLAQKGDMEERVANEFLDQAVAAFLSGSYAVKMAVMAALRRYMQHSLEHAFKVCRKVESCCESADDNAKSLYRFVSEEAQPWRE